MTTFTDAIGGRTLAPVNDTMIAGALIGSSDQEYIEEDGSASRAWRHEDTASGLVGDFLPNWGTTDWTMGLYVSAPGSYNPSGFPTYRAWSLCDSGYDNSPLYLRSNTTATLGLVIDTVAMQTISKGWNVIRLESSNMTDGLVQKVFNGRQGASAAHGVGSTPSRTTPTIHQLGGKYQSSDFGILGGVRFSNFWIAHEWVSNEELREMYRVLRALK